ncbi:DNA ligase, NAD-dependent (plasmid) [Pseudarthrobacter chlorophenolicus A6]|uniref:DNA ligase 2 n=1 Tax=Pseudarthrobacter chlorophenolicus (strain ATCC 700700 / DSM 12829 / CIP 107037 / JCM 12360 / KCTC 9906 / NCIMB 13794 / A6) TaxID=452863 RepID=DNLJ2_PSECP|nr:NAD-dependent DNA ligase LigA [Pseudarthrobacter chlorophenolicus]B8HIQ9.1 RecName: Full=DNA ligase 2; AltName: Full=Polydeoxyribonucleotide synthase [NAD(+)] 2 [Pseudarthrobacter chlorophenolicus A6]ACL42306.1 DNA ligase, NAD-dependent [Pseudarthrobacter chlorophenolicus A6]SDQ16267.1 DNA ligase (NAD+) [Pseudarthrobacter chlorophenolicus]
MSPAPQNRQPSGVPVGGQFAATNHAEPGIGLATFGSEEEYQAAVTTALSAAKAYETTDVEEMNDAEFDRLLAKIASHEAANGIEPEHDLHDTIGHGGAGGGDVEHATPMKSLEKPGEDAVIEFAAKHPKAVIEPKIDGLAISVRYENGKMVRAARRGDGYTGEDVTDRVRGVDGLPEMAGDGDYEVRGELYLNDENKAKANAIRQAAGKAPFANARNGVAGMLNKQDGSYAGLFSFAAYSTTIDEKADHLDSMQQLEGMGFTTARSLLPQSVLDAEDPMAAIAALGAERKGLNFLMDGAVLKVNTAAERAELGEGSRAPKWAVAYKYPAVEEPTVIEDIEYNIGKTGRLSIRARLTPVEVDGSVVEYASLHNVGHLQAADMRIGDTVSAYKANDIIPQVHLPRADLRDESSQPWQPPSVCPQCSEPFDKSTELWRCHTPECSVSGRISYAASRDAGLDIEGLGGSIGDALIEKDLVKDVSDLFYLGEDQLAEVELGETSTGGTRTLGQKNAAKIMAEIEKAKSQPLNRVITALSMRFTGRTFGRRLAAEFGTMEALQAATVSQLANVEGIGQKKAEVIHEQLKKNAPVIAKLREAGVNMGAPKAAPAAGAKAPKLTKPDGKPMNVVVTGSVKGSPLGSLSRSGVQELIEAKGGKASGSVSKTTDLLVCGEPGSSKFLKAQELGIRIVTPDEFAQMVEDGEV